MSWNIGSDALCIESNLDFTQAGNQALHMVSLFLLCFGESVDPHLQLEVNCISCWYSKTAFSLFDRGRVNKLQLPLYYPT